MDQKSNCRVLITAALLCVFIIALFAGGNRKKDNALELWQVLDRRADNAFRHYEIEKACRYWQRSLKENPENLKAYNKLGISYLLLKKHDRAIEILEKGLNMERNNPGLNYNLALACYYSGDNERALRELQKVLELNCNYPEANYLRGLCLENIGEVKEAQRAYVEELNNNPGSPSAWQKVKREL